MQETVSLNTLGESIPAPSDSVLAWAREILGPFQIASRYAHDHDYSELWRLQTEISPGPSAFFWLKCHRYPGKWAGEVNALANWASPLGLPVPQIQGFRETPPAVLLTEIEGVSANTIPLDDTAERKLWFAAGEFLRTLHSRENDWFGAVHPDGTPQGEPHRDAEAFVRRSIESRLQQGKDRELFDTTEAAFIASAADDWCAALQGESPRAIHRDYSPRNWMTDSSGTLHGVIDFEHARWDVRAADLNRWWDIDFVEKPHLAPAFFDGYLGGMPDSRLSAQIRALRLLGAAAGIVWATQVSDLPYVQTNRNALHRLMQERT